jgi:hypothetical protein
MKKRDGLELDGIDAYKKIAEPFTRQVLEDYGFKNYRVVCRKNLKNAAAVAIYDPNKTKSYIIQFRAMSLASLWWLTYSRTFPNSESEICACGNVLSYTSLTRVESIKFIALHEVAHLLIFRANNKGESLIAKYCDAHPNCDGHHIYWIAALQLLLEKYIVKEREEEKLRKERQRQYGRRIREFCGNCVRTLQGRISANRGTRLFRL